MRVAVIGAGAAGLAAAKYMVTGLSQLERLVVYESASDVGGTWSYTEETGKDKYGWPIHSSMYRDMRTNLPKEAMAFSDFPFPEGVQSFVSHRAVLQYLKDFAQNFDLYKFIRFNERVLSVDKSSNSWHLVSEGVENKNKEENEFDAIFVCNGHYFTPYIPEIEGLSDYNGIIMHSHNYRMSDPFQGKTVACLGAGPSGTDIAIELSYVCPFVYLCHNRPNIKAILPSNVIQKPGFTSFSNDSITLLNGETIATDAVVFCTGYNFDFPFLDKNQLPLSVADNRVTPLYQHIVHIEQPSLFFIGLNLTVLPFPNFECQVKFALSILNGNMKLPSKNEMYESEKEDFRYRIEQLGIKAKYAHYLGRMQWNYYRKLAELGHFENPIKPVIEVLYDAVHDHRHEDLANYKKSSWKIIGSDVKRLDNVNE